MNGAVQCGISHSQSWITDVSLHLALAQHLLSLGPLIQAAPGPSVLRSVVYGQASSGNQWASGNVPSTESLHVTCGLDVLYLTSEL